MHEAIYYQQKQQHKFRRQLFSLNSTVHSKSGNVETAEEETSSRLIKIHKKFKIPIPDAVFTDIQSNNPDEMNSVIEHLKFMSFTTAQGNICLFDLQLFLFIRWRILG